MKVEALARVETYQTWPYNVIQHTDVPVCDETDTLTGKDTDTYVQQTSIRTAMDYDDCVEFGVALTSEKCKTNLSSCSGSCYGLQLLFFLKVCHILKKREIANSHGIEG